MIDSEDLIQLRRPEIIEKIPVKSKKTKSVFVQVDAPAKDEYLVDISATISDDIYKSLDEHCGQP
jgi:hypothetical protein